MLEDLFGNGPLVKILDFFLENRFWDYTKTDIAGHSAISRTQLYKVWSVILEAELVKETRKIGATTLYQANMDSPIMRRLEKLSLTVADEKNKKTLETEELQLEEVSIEDMVAVKRSPIPEGKKTVTMRKITT